MDLIESINNTISKLDDKQDIFLIQLLEQKLYGDNQLLMEKHSVTDYQIETTKRGIQRVLKEYLNPILYKDAEYEKINKILHRTGNCRYCKYSIIKVNEYPSLHYKREYKDMDDNTVRCKRCYERIEILEERQYKMREQIDEVVLFTLSNPDLEYVLKCKAIINKLKTKLRTYVTS